MSSASSTTRVKINREHLLDNPVACRHQSLKPKLQSCKSRNFEALGSAEGLEQEKLNLKSSHYRTIQQINVLGLKLYLD